MALPPYKWRLAHWPQQRCREKGDRHFPAIASPRWGWDGLHRLPGTRRLRRGCRRGQLPPSSGPLQRPGRPARPLLQELSRSCIAATLLPSHLSAPSLTISGRLQTPTSVRVYRIFCLATLIHGNPAILTVLGTG